MIPAFKILRIAILMAVVMLIGTVGYRVLLGWSWLDALYFTMITVTTVGFGEIHQLGDAGRIFTIVLMFGSVGIVMYSATTITQLVMEMQFSHIRWRRRMERKIGSATGHYIVCGMGRMGRTGRAVYNTLIQAGRTVVVIEGDPPKVEQIKEENVLLIEGDATNDECLVAAGIQRARGLVASLGNDATNVYMILSARELNPQINIVSWATTEEAERKILQAGADHVMSPYLMGGARLAQ
ncbi:MAG TPA: potassium channel family protein, partial [bacterium]